MGRAIGSKNKRKSASIKAIRTRPVCPRCGGGSFEQVSSGQRCSDCYSLYAAGQNIKDSLHPHYYKVKDLPAGQWNASSKGVFRVIDYV